jgi:hypothetical protein
MFDFKLRSEQNYPELSKASRIIYVWERFLGQLRYKNVVKQYFTKEDTVAVDLTK